jgi:hypothetical protein
MTHPDRATSTSTKCAVASNIAPSQTKKSMDTLRTRFSPGSSAAKGHAVDGALPRAICRELLNALLFGTVASQQIRQ